MKLNKLAAVIAAATLITACGSDSDSNDNNTATPEPGTGVVAIDVAKVKQVVDTNADIAYAAYSDSVDTAKALKTALETLRKEPTKDNLEAAKKAWLVAREPYGQTEVYRFRNSPIDSTDYSSEDGPEGDINAWPLGEALIDYVKVNTTDFGDDQVGVTANQAGINGGGALTANDANTDNTNNIIGDISITINDDLLANTATADDEHDVIAGYHAIEFLLWGQDLNTTDQSVTDGTDRDQAVNTGVMGGQRPLSDFEPGYADGAYDSSKLSDRRHKFMEVAVNKLIADLESVRDGWADGASYHTAFTTVENETQAKQKLAEILTGMGTLSQGELAGERMQIAFASNSQEDEHSCFSDNTHRDIWLNAEGVSNSYYGDYSGYDHDLDGTDGEGSTVSGYGIDDYLKDVGLTTQATALEAALKATAEAYTKVDQEARNGKPFDVQIMAANAKDDSPAAETILALDAQSKLITQLAEALNIDEEVVQGDASACDTTDPLNAGSCDG